MTEGCKEAQSERQGRDRDSGSRGDNWWHNQGNRNRRNWWRRAAPRRKRSGYDPREGKLD